MLLSLILGMLVGAISVVFILQNITVVTVSFFTWQMTGSLAVILFLAMLGGIVMTLLLILPSLIKDEFYLSAIKKHKKELEDELAQSKVALAAAHSQQSHPEMNSANKVMYPAA